MKLPNNNVGIFAAFLAGGSTLGTIGVLLAVFFSPFWWFALFFAAFSFFCAGIVYFNDVPRDGWTGGHW